MTVRESPKGVRPNGSKIRTLRKQAGFTQRDLAARSAITARTLQRAENGEPILPEILNSIAAALKVASAELGLKALTITAGTKPAEKNKELVRLPRTVTAQQIVSALAQVQQLVFEYDIDPDDKTAQEVAAVVEIVEQLTGKPDSSTSEPSMYVRQLGNLNSMLSRLEEWGIRFFVGSYWEPTVMIEDEDESAPNQSSQYCRIEMISRGIMLISQANVRYLTRSVILKYTDEQFDANIEELKSFGWEVEDRRI